jgi:6-methylsalicylic acid synthase
MEEELLKKPNFYQALVSLDTRRALPARNMWSHIEGDIEFVARRIQQLERKIVTIHRIALNISASDADSYLLTAIERLSIPRLLGVIHAAGVFEDDLIIDTTSASFGRVLSSKLAGTLALHRASPPNALDFFILFSSIG